jgi:omega-6 fatty acid desaturase (delta-12 desaturase)
MKYKSSYTSTFFDLSVHAFLMCSSFYSLWYFRNSWLSVFTVPFLGLLNLRTYSVFHDCGHNSYAPIKIFNYIIGSLLGVFIFMPMCWNWHHRNHHLTNGYINNHFNHKFNETVFHTLRKYKQFNRKRQIIYKRLKHPFVYFTVIPILYFGIKQRTEVWKNKRNKKHPYTQSSLQILFETVSSNVLISVFMYYLWEYEIVTHYLSAMFVFSTIAMMVLHNEHTFNPSYAVENDEWNYRDSGLFGSSLILFPKWFKYFSMGVEYHHIHHINAKIPGYNLQKYHEEVVSKTNMFDNVIKLSMTDCYNNLWLVLYDEDKKKYITFAEADEEIRNNKDV